MRSACWKWGVVCWLGWASVASAGEVSPFLTNEALVQQLADDSFSARQQATRELIARGLKTKPALTLGLQHRDPEIRRRSDQILQTILLQDYHARLEAFEADTQGLAEHELAGWPRFRQVIGSTVNDRKLFVSMHRQEPELMMSLERGPEAVAEELEKRCDSLQLLFFAGDDDNPKDLTLGSAAALYFLAADPVVPISESSASHISNMISYRPTVDKAMNRVATKVAMKKLLGAWVGREVDPFVTVQNFSVAMQYDLPEVLGPAVRILQQTGLDAELRQLAIHVVGRYGTLENHRPLLESLLKDETAYMIFDANPKKANELQIRDLALVMLLRMTKQSAKDYGFTGTEEDTQWVYTPGSPRFRPRTKRETAFKKWAEWSAAHPLINTVAHQKP